MHAPRTPGAPRSAPQASFHPTMGSNMSRCALCCNRVSVIQDGNVTPSTYLCLCFHCAIGFGPVMLKTLNLNAVAENRMTHYWRGHWDRD